VADIDLLDAYSDLSLT